MAEDEGKFRLVTRGDFDGVVSGALLRELKIIGPVTFAYPKDVQDGLVPLGQDDITANLPYDRRVQRAFDHHHSETIRLEHSPDNFINQPDAPSAARVLHEFYGGKEAFPRINPELLPAVDRADSAQYSIGDVREPAGWTLLNFMTDARTGLGRFDDFGVSNEDMLRLLIELVGNRPVEDILARPEVRERVDLYTRHRELFEDQMRRCTRKRGSLAVLDLREEETIYVGNRFLIYAMFPETNISIHVMWGRQRRNTVFAVGKSIFDRSARTNIGQLMLARGGGGHPAAGTCQVANDQAEGTLDLLIAAIETGRAPADQTKGSQGT